jgi:plasmid stabilization system protein ParE
MGWRVTLSDQADRDLGYAVAFLAQRNPRAAERLGMGIVATSFSPAAALTPTQLGRGSLLQHTSNGCTVLLRRFG